jgi:histidine transport system permease protein/arginine/ornithine transport system permease protein
VTLDLALIGRSLPLFGDALGVSLALTGVALACGAAIALPMSVARLSPRRGLARAARAYTWFFTGTPMLLQLLMVYFGLSQFEWMQADWAAGNPLLLPFREPFFCAALAFSLNTGAYTTEILAGALRNTDRGDIEAAQALGMTRAQALRRIVMPAALRRALPAYGNEVILMLQGSSIASAVTLLDLTGAARQVYAVNYAPFEAFLTVGAIYLLVTLCLIAAFRFAEHRFLAHLRVSRH